MKRTFSIIIFLFILTIILVRNKYEPFITDPCAYKLSDRDYLAHMIPHHQVAIDMSNMLIDSGINDPILLHLCRDIIRKQDYEIWEMNFFLKNISETIFDEQKGKVMSCKTMLDKYAPVLSKSKDGD